MEPKRGNLKWLSLPFLPSKELLRFLIVVKPVLPPPGFPLASLLAPFGSCWPPFWLPLASFGLPVGAFCHPLASSRLPWSCSGLQSFSSPEEAKFWQDFAKILPRFCLERAENLLRTSRESAVRTSSKLSFHIAVSLGRLRSEMYSSLNSLD